MDQKTDVADRQVGDTADFLVTEVAAELEREDFPLLNGKSFHQVEDLPKSFLLFEYGQRPRAGTWASVEVQIVQRAHPAFLAADVEGPVAAHREQPLRKVIPHSCRLLFAKTQVGVLNDLTGSLNVAKDSSGVPDERTFVPIEGELEEIGFGCIVSQRSRPPFHLPITDNDPGETSLEI